MTTKQIKTEIYKVLDEVPESILLEILDYLKSVKGKSESELKRAKNLRRILIEDRELLEKLAQ